MNKPADSATAGADCVGLSVEGVAAMLGVSPNHVRRMAAEGVDNFPRSRRIGARVLWDRDAVLAWFRRDTLTVNRGGVAVQVRG